MSSCQPDYAHDSILGLPFPYWLMGHRQPNDAPDGVLDLNTTPATHSYPVLPYGHPMPDGTPLFITIRYPTIYITGHQTTTLDRKLS